MSNPETLPETVELPLLPLRDVVVFPHMVIPLFVGRPKSIKALEVAMESGRSILLVAQKSAAKDEPEAADLYRIGCMANILQMLKLPDGTVKVLVEGTQRATVDSIDAQPALFMATATPLTPAGVEDHEIEAMRRAVVAQFDQFVKLVNAAEVSQCHDRLGQIRCHLSGVRFRIQGQTAVPVIGHFKIARFEQLLQLIAIRRFGFLSDQPQ
mgnify:CR=1 FL=1